MSEDAETPPPAAPQPLRAPSLPFGSLAFAGALGSLLTCYGRIALDAFLGVESVQLNPHVQAAVMGVFGVVALWGLWRDRPRHGRSYPLLLGTAGVAVLVATLYVAYDARFEVLAYVLLVVGALLNQTAMVSKLYGTTLSQKRVIQDLNANLEEKVERQVRQIERLSRLRDFLPSAVADLVVTEGKEALLDSHRRYVACLFCDIRNFTSLAEGLEPEETIALLQTYHGKVGDRVARRGGTIGYRAGDGLMVFFNDPVPCDRPVLTAAKLALDIHEEWQEVRERWQRLGHRIGIGIGIASGYATLGLVGKEGRADYTAIGNVVNLASRLCDKAGDGEVLIERRAYADIEGDVEVEALEPLSLDGVGQPVTVYRLAALAGSQGAGAERSAAAR